MICKKAKTELKKIENKRCENIKDYFRHLEELRCFNNGVCPRCGSTDVKTETIWKKPYGFILKHINKVIRYCNVCKYKLEEE